MGKGISMRILLDDTKPADSLDRWINEVTCEGGPDSDTLVVPLHWHKYHSERSNVVEGRAEVTLDGKARVVTAGEEIYIPAGVVHGIKGFKGERAVLRERADPPGDYKSM
ncbi:hypothetical protein SLS53_005751 [Cytospora paraplurivora]|uniref:Cupin type-2 domain-containing protein n=1 Tax=Cytospora paraplurivora TaxID=2898453 RepID=A0AAN9YE99_9PEZI